MAATTTEGIGPGAAGGPLANFSVDNIRKVFIKDGDLYQTAAFLENNKWVLRVSPDGQIKIDADDNADYLGDKLVAGTNITLTETIGPNKTIIIAASGGSMADPTALSGEFVIDEETADWLVYQDVLVIEPTTNLAGGLLFIDLDKPVTGWRTLALGLSDITFQVLRKIDGVNWRITETFDPINTADATELGLEISMNSVGVTEDIKVMAKLSAETKTGEQIQLPYVFYYTSTSAPTITPSV